jgi:hypothetical protein
VLVIIASRHDGVARRLAERWAAHEAALLTCEDLSAAGWCHPVGAAGRSTAVVGGRVVAVEGISGVLTRRPYVVEQELGHIVPADRAYVASEMTAFLLSWLSSLECPVLNRPTPSGLSGPNWWPEQWAYAAARSGLPVRPVRRRAALADDAPAAADPPPLTVTIVGERCIGPVDPALAAQARRFARAVGVDLLAVHFSGPEPGAEFLGADLWPDVTAPEIASAIFEYLSEGGG